MKPQWSSDSMDFAMTLEEICQTCCLKIQARMLEMLEHGEKRQENASA